MTSRRPCWRSVRSLTSAMPWSFFAPTMSLILAMTFSGPTVNGSSVTTRPLGRGVLHGHRGADLEGAAPGLVRVADAGQADDPAAGGQVGPGHVPHQGVEVGARIPDQVAGGGDHLAEVVRRHVGGHADRDPGRAVDQQVGVRRGQYARLLLLAVVVRCEVDGVLVDRLDHELGRAGHPGLGVAHRGRQVVQRAEVAVAVDERQALREGLRHPHHRVVDRRVAVRVQLAHHLADDPGALDVAAVGAQPHLVHLVDDAAVHRLHAVAGVGQRARVDHRVGVLKERALHLVHDVDVEDALLEVVVGWRGLRRAAGHLGGAPSSWTGRLGPGDWRGTGWGTAGAWGTAGTERAERAGWTACTGWTGRLLRIIVERTTENADIHPAR